MSYLEMRGITKLFPGVTALDSVNFEAERGEVHAIAGENGAGKSTLIKILSGAYTPNSGSIWLDGKELNITDPFSGRKQGVMVIYQELSLVPTTSIAENIFLGNMPKRNGMINRKEMNRRAREALEEIGFDLNPDRRISTLSIAEQQAVEIAKIMVEDAKIVVMDEPTALLPPKDVETLFKVIRTLKARGVTVLYISHRLQEIFTIADRVTVFKDGKDVGTVRTADIDEKQLVSMMVGRDVQVEDFWTADRKELLAGAPNVLELKGLQSDNLLGDGVDLKLRKGEILGVAGLVGSGKSELVQAIFGGLPQTGGEVIMNGEHYTSLSPGKSIKNGLGYLPADRKNTGLVLQMSIRENCSLASLEKVSRSGILNRHNEVEKVNETIKKLKLKYRSIEQPAMSLSGGNQQKVVMTKWLLPDCGILMFDEPTRGIDVGARREIYELILDYSRQGGSVIMVSSDTHELLGICDRILVMAGGQCTAEFEHEMADEDKIVHAMF